MEINRPADRIDFIFYNSRRVDQRFTNQRLTFLPVTVFGFHGPSLISVSFQQRLLSGLFKHICRDGRKIYLACSIPTIRLGNHPSIRAPLQRSPYGPTPTDFNGFCQFQSTGQHDAKRKVDEVTNLLNLQTLVAQHRTPSSPAPSPPMLPPGRRSPLPAALKYTRRAHDRHTPDTYPVSTLSDDPAAIFQQLKSTHNAVTLTIDGHPEFVIHEAAEYQRLLDLAAWADEEQAIQQGMDDIKHGRTRPAHEVFEEIRAKHAIPR